MLDALPYLAANALWLGSGAGAARAFHRALWAPRRAQEARLRSLLSRNAGSNYGRRHGFARIRSPREYQDAVPVVTYDTLERAIEAIRQGRAGVLTAEPVRMLERTGGATSPSKYIPFTAGLTREFQAALAPWMADLYGRRLRMLGGGAYWSVSPLAAEPEVTEGGLPVGFEEDSEYFGSFARRLLARLLLTPRQLPRIADIEASRYVALRFLLRTDRLTFISVWNPSFLLLLLRGLEEHAEQLVADIQQGMLTPPAPLPAELRRALSAQLQPQRRRARCLQRLLEDCGGLPPARVWPRLETISCWTNASAARFLPAVAELFPQVEIQPKGLLSTEGVVSIPLTGYPGAALAVTSHFLEFVDEAAPAARPLLADELAPGGIYQVLLTTGGGLYRYALGDRVRVVGRCAATPLVEFLGRADPVCDLCGEKLHEDRVHTVLEAAFREFQLRPAFAMLAPEWGQPPAYVLFIEEEGLTDTLAQALARRIDARLAEGHHYAYCRRLGQLGPVQTFLLRRLPSPPLCGGAPPLRAGNRQATGAAESYLERCARLGQRRGDVKPVSLHPEPGWAAWFENGDPRCDPVAAKGGESPLSTLSVERRVPSRRLGEGGGP